MQMSQLLTSAPGGQPPRRKAVLSELWKSREPLASLACLATSALGVNSSPNWEPILKEQMSHDSHMTSDDIIS